MNESCEFNLDTGKNDFNSFRLSKNSTNIINNKFCESDNFNSIKSLINKEYENKIKEINIEIKKDKLNDKSMNEIESLLNLIEEKKQFLMKNNYDEIIFNSNLKSGEYQNKNV